MENNSPFIVVWDDKYATGLEPIDTQHKKLLDLTNELYQACLVNDKTTVDTVFKDAMSRMVEYVRYHFGIEQEILKRVNYPEYTEHKNQHETLIKQILDASKDFTEGKKFVPNNFVRTLRDWILGHIGFYDKRYAAYIHEKKISIH